MYTRIAAVFFCLLVVGASLALWAQSTSPRPATAQSTPTQPASASSAQERWRAQQLEASRQSEQIMHTADARKGMLARYQVMRNAYRSSTDTAFRLIFSQYVSWYQSFVGDYPAASSTFFIKEAAQPGDHPSPLAAGGYSPHLALGAIAHLAGKYQLVMLNEAHNVPLTRTLTVQLLPKLRAQGFNYFAVETVYQTDTGLTKRGYPTADSGFYTAEPISAEMVRTALKLGFHVIGYEALSDATGDAREVEQAGNIYREVFQRDPGARLVVHAGYAHIQQSGEYLGGRSMAQHLHDLSGIDALAVEQTMLVPRPNTDDNHPVYNAIVQQLQPCQPIVFTNASDQPWSLRDGYSVSVIFPPQQLRRDRPSWLDLGGLRQPYLISGERCRERYPCLVEARYANEGDDAIPADRMVLDLLPGSVGLVDRIRQNRIAPVGELYLRPGAYRLSFSDADARVMYVQNISAASPFAAGDGVATAATAGQNSHDATATGGISVQTGTTPLTELEPVRVISATTRSAGRLGC